MRLRRHPRRHEAAVAAAAGADLGTVHVRTLRDDVHRLHQVIVVLHAPASARAVREIRTVAARPARIREEHHDALRREVLEFVEPPFVVLAVRSAVDIQHDRILLARDVAVRLHQPRLDFEVAHAAIRESFRIAPRDFRVQCVVEMRELLLVRAACVGDIQLGRFRHRRDDVRHHLRRVVETRIRRTTTAADQFLRRTTVHVRIENCRATADRRRESDCAGAQPRDAFRLVLPRAEEVLRRAACDVDDVDTRRLRARRTADERELPAVLRPFQIRLGAHPLGDLARRTTGDRHHVDVSVVALRVITHPVVRQATE